MAFLLEEVAATGRTRWYEISF